jgi:hypothetical protein
MCNTCGRGSFSVRVCCGICWTSHCVNMSNFPGVSLEVSVSFRIELHYFPPSIHKTIYNRSHWPLPGVCCKGILACVFTKQPVSWFLVLVDSPIRCTQRTSWPAHSNQFLLVWFRNQSWSSPSYIRNTSSAFSHFCLEYGDMKFFPKPGFISPCNRPFEAARLLVTVIHTLVGKHESIPRNIR